MADDEGEGRQQQRRTITACEIRRRTTKGTDKSGRREMAETRSAMTAAEADDGGDGR